ncbi:MAG: ComEC/Rec2 family competence protein, partial [Elusimicrobiota bacterium]
MKNSIRGCLTPDKAAILNGIFIGEKTMLSQEIKDDFTNAGVMHLLVASGLNVGYVTAIFWFVMRFLPLPNFWRRILLVTPVIAYCFIAGANPPIVRATVMALSVIACYILERESLIYHSLALAAFVIMIFDPPALFGASFQLSFAACLGIFYIYPKLTKSVSGQSEVVSGIWYYLRLTLHDLRLLFCVSLSAQIAVAPLLAYYFYKLSIISIAANLILVPFAGIMLWLCFVQFFVFMFFPPLLSITTFLCDMSAGLMIYLADFFAGLPGAVWHTGQPPVALIVSLYASGFIFIALKKFVHKIITLCLIIFLIFF